MENINNNTPTEEKTTAKSIWSKAKESLVKAVDQNNDGSFDMKDVSALAGSLGNAAKNTASAMRTGVEERARDMRANAEERAKETERKLLQPIFPEDVERTDFHVSKLIRITKMDKKRAESEVCKGSIGYVSDQKELRVVNIFKENIDLFRIKLIPDADSELYYVDPTDRDCYIALDDYFARLKEERVRELQKIAQDLGAKYFRVIFKEEKASFLHSAFKAVASAKASSMGNAATEASRESMSDQAVSVAVAAEMHCPGHEPVEPKLRYMQNETSIHSLIELRMDKTSSITQHKYTFQLSKSSGIKESDAIKIDAALKVMKIVGNTTLQNEVKNESRRFFEYEIEF